MLTKIKNDIAAVLQSLTNLSQVELIEMLEIPKQFAHGDLALPVFGLAKILRKPPVAIAQDIVARLNSDLPSILTQITADGGFVNFRFKTSYLQDVLMKAVCGQGMKLGYSNAGNGRHVVIDYSSPNVAKPMSIGHLRATVIGQAIRNLAVTQGYRVTGINHLGDWGAQFGKLAWAYKNWGHEYPFATEPFQSLYKLYVRFHDEAERNPALEQAGAACFKQLEEGDPEIFGIWQMCVELSLKEYNRLWELLGVKHDLIRGESFFNDKLDDVVARLEKLNLLRESDGARVVFVGDDLPPCLIRKSDGASLYATRDLAAAIYRYEVLAADINLYVVGSEQNLHFQQFFRVLKQMGYSWAKDCHHISFGLYQFKDTGKMSARKGNVVALEDVVSKAIELIAKIIAEKNPELPNKDVVARQVGVGAVIFNDLVNDRLRNIDFDWQKVIDFEGDSGPYVQYSRVRCHSILQKYGKTLPERMSVELTSEAERFLVSLLLRYNDILKNAFSQFRPNILAQYLLEVCRAFGHFYHSHRVLGEEQAIEQSRIALVYATNQVLISGLKVLNIESPDAM